MTEVTEECYLQYLYFRAAGNDNFTVFSIKSTACHRSIYHYYFHWASAVPARRAHRWPQPAAGRAALWPGYCRCYHYLLVLAPRVLLRWSSTLVIYGSRRRNRRRPWARDWAWLWSACFCPYRLDREKSSRMNLLSLEKPRIGCNRSLRYRQNLAGFPRIIERFSCGYHYSRKKRE